MVEIYRKINIVNRWLWQGWADEEGEYVRHGPGEGADTARYEELYQSKGE